MSRRSIIQEKVDLVELVNVFGANVQEADVCYVGQCPLHPEDDSCFLVWDQNGEYECTQCGIKGDVFDFLRDVADFGYEEAQAYLAELFNIPFEDLLNIEVCINPRIRRLSHRMPQEQLLNGVYEVLVVITKCGLSKDSESELLTKLKKQTGITVVKLRRLMRRVRQNINHETAIARFIEGHEERESVIKYRKFKKEFALRELQNK